MVWHTLYDGFQFDMLDLFSFFRDFVLSIQIVVDYNSTKKDRLATERLDLQESPVKREFPPPCTLIGMKQPIKFLRIC